MTVYTKIKDVYILMDNETSPTETSDMFIIIRKNMSFNSRYRTLNGHLKFIRYKHLTIYRSPKKTFPTLNERELELEITSFTSTNESSQGARGTIEKPLYFYCYHRLQSTTMTTKRFRLFEKGRHSILCSLHIVKTCLYYNKRRIIFWLR